MCFLVIELRSCCTQCCRAIGDPERGKVWGHNKTHKTLLNLESGGPGGTLFQRTKALRL